MMPYERESNKHIVFSRFYLPLCEDIFFVDPLLKGQLLACQICLVNRNLFLETFTELASQHPFKHKCFHLFNFAF